jgi:hypothetical protein
LERRDFSQAAQVPFSLTKLRRQKCLEQVPSYTRPYGTATHTYNVHVVVLDALLGREMVVDQGGTNAQDLVGANGRSHTTPADGNPAVHITCGDRLGKGENEIGVIIAGFMR